MLKCVLFWVSGYAYDSLKPELENIRRDLRDARVEVLIQIIKAGSAQGDIRKLTKPCCDRYSRREILYITDEPDAFKLIMKEGLYGVALFHDRNRNKKFEDAKYGVEDVEQLSYRSYEEAYRRLAGIPWDIFTTEHLAVRESTVEDVEEFYRIYGEPSITYYMENLFPEHDKEREYMEAYIRHMYGFYGFGLWTVMLKDSGRIVGRAGLNVREGFELPELGYLIETQYQHMGYAYEVCRAVLKYAAEELAFDRIQALSLKENTASICLLNKLGFLFDREILLNKHPYQLYIKALL